MTEKMHVLVEGISEESFVKRILTEYLMPFGIFPNPVILQTKRAGSDPAFKGGAISYIKFKKQVMNLINDSSSILLTTMIDYYGLPLDFPGVLGINSQDPLANVKFIENSLREDVDDERFYPYLQMHEFEALVLAEPIRLQSRFPDDAYARQKAIQLLKMTDEFPSPEYVNTNSPPSHRIKTIFPGYRKISHGFVTVSEIGIERLKERCSHFREWINFLESANQD